MDNLYDKDFNLWIEDQKESLSTKKFDNLDIKNLIEELDGMAKRDFREMTALLKNLISNILEFNYRKDLKNTTSMDDNIISTCSSHLVSYREEILAILEDSPSLKEKLSDALETAYQRAKRDTVVGLNFSIVDENKKLNDKSFPDTCPWSFEKIMDEYWLAK